MTDTVLEPITNYTFGRGVQKSSIHGGYRWWFCQEENKICPDFELSKLGVVIELYPNDALQRLYDAGEEAWMSVYSNYPEVRNDMDDFILKQGINL